MSAYQALYRKYRPQTFDDVSGQMAVTQTLKTQIMTGKMSHAYLFTGSRGTGKTSCAKILAKAVNCLNPDHGNPCNVCEACKAIDSGSCMDVLEIDAASNNGVDNVRDLRDDAIYTPSQVKMRVYIIDEVHMLSISAFNALLKIIEEPPEHLLFILATTELHKVPATILSRCQRFSFRRIGQEDIAARLQYVAYQENIDLDDGAARVIARLADGGMRDGLSLLDQCASATTGELTAERVYACLGIAGERKCGEMMGYIAAHDTKNALELFNRLYTEGKDLSGHAGRNGLPDPGPSGAENRRKRRDHHAFRRGVGQGSAGTDESADQRRAGSHDGAASGDDGRFYPKRQPPHGRGAVHCGAVPAGAESGYQSTERPSHPAGRAGEERRVCPGGSREGGQGRVGEGRI